jgi:hypothetical protein
MSLSVNINITALNPDAFEKDSSSTASAAIVALNGNIDLSGVDCEVDISWTIDSNLDAAFKPLSPPPGPIMFRTITAPPVAPGSGIFGTPVLSNENRTVSVSDANSSTATVKVFNYTLFQTNGVNDPRVTNR